MAGDSNTRARAEMFDLLLEDGPLCLTAITRISWGRQVERVDRVLFFLAEHRCVDTTAEEFGIEAHDVRAIAEASGENEFDTII